MIYAIPAGGWVAATPPLSSVASCRVRLAVLDPDDFLSAMGLLKQSGNGIFVP
ncbi:MAG: hypothetical protein JNL84_13835 [Candidatus Accumulibacter sp.]|nr:hypothetical protein [Accumulibacter sp.]